MNLLKIFRTWLDHPPRQAGGSGIPGDRDTSTSLTTEAGFRPPADERFARLMTHLYVDSATISAIRDIREMDRADQRVKRIHGRVTRDMIKGGLQLTMRHEDARVRKEWSGWIKRVGLLDPRKLASHARGLVMEGNLYLQWLYDGLTMVGAVRMPADTMIPQTDTTGRFRSPTAAWKQVDQVSGGDAAAFALYQMSHGRLDPANADDVGSMGRPLLDASREVWRKLRMTELDMVLRRHARAPQRMVHVLENASPEDVQAYKKSTENAQGEVTTDFYLNRKGSVTAVGGDATLGDIEDVTYLLDTFFAGAPGPKGLFGYSGDLSRDILEDLTRAYYEEIDGLQDVFSYLYEEGFRLQLLLMGLDPDRYELSVQFAERLTETPTQRADRALKLQALGASRTTVLEVSGVDPEIEAERLEVEASDRSPYPDPTNIGPGGGGGVPRVSITPGNARKGGSSTDISATRPRP